MQSPLFPKAAKDSLDSDVAAHYGDLSGEQWALEKGTAFSDMSDMGIVTVSGPDRLSWLTTISSQVVDPMTPADSKELLLLDANGRISFAAAVLDDGEKTTLLVEGDRADALVEFLESMKFMLRVSIENATERVGVVGAIVPSNHEAINRAREDVAEYPGYLVSWVDPWPGVVEGGASYTQPGFEHPAKPRTRILHLIERDKLTQFAEEWADDGGKWAGRIAWEALRIEDFRPRWGREVDEKSVPHELDWLRTAVHLNKGCYSGQESVARIVNMGKPPRRLVLLQLDGSESKTVKPGDEVQAKGRAVGRVTSVARHADWGPIALAVIRRGIAIEVLLDVVTEEGPIIAAQEMIVDPAGKSSQSPKERPGKDLRGIRRGVEGHRPIGGMGLSK
ncbi:MAG: folate-binding protein [Actinomycetaceae bacterium]|nr:folate-binding protein [Actinomycetaceae bacterium]